jgi:hypothetical protein
MTPVKDARGSTTRAEAKVSARGFDLETGLKSRFISGCGAELWIHGHIHQRADFIVGGTRVVENPRGYPTEPLTGFDPAWVIEL